MKVRFRPEAALEAREARAFYAEREHSLARSSWLRWSRGHADRAERPLAFLSCCVRQSSVVRDFDASPTSSCFGWLETRR